MTIILPIGKPHPNGRGSNQGRVGVFGIALHTYWEQFPGFKQRLEGYRRFVESQVVRFALPPGEFIDRWCGHAPTHHFALGVGHRRAAVPKVAELMGIALEVVA